MSLSDGKSVVTLETKDSKGEAVVSGKKKFKMANPLKAAQNLLARRRVREDKRMLRREELMKQDAERFLMELEEKHTWLAYELRERNFTRMVREQHVHFLTDKEEKAEKARLLEQEKEQGLAYFRGQIQGYRRWQNSAAKHLDISGHTGSVASVKLTPCLGYIVSCSSDKTINVWALRSGKCLLTLTGHTKKVNDVDIHPNFSMNDYNVSIVSCSSDCTLRYWNCVVNEPIKVVCGHSEAVYKCSFAPGGQRVASCSEDQTARVWTVPEGYLLFIYQVHSSPVSTVKFSPSGRYIVTGSDYGERRLILWDATYPKFESPAQLPHMIYWTPEGLIRKILFKKTTPNQHFWLTQKQLGQLDQDEQVETWVGENATLDDVKSDSDENQEDDDDMGEEDSFGRDDIKDQAGCAVSVTGVDKFGEQFAADEYIAGGGTLVISLQSIVDPLAEAFVSVNLKDPQYEAYSSQSGARVGHFRASGPIPWRPFITDPLNLRPPHRIPPNTVKETCEGKAFQYKEKREFNRITGEEIFPSVAVEMLWTSPPPNMGPVVVTVNFRLRSEKQWRKLTYSLKESPIRLNSGDDDSVAQDGNRFLFDQEERHDTFWRFVREQNWEAVESFFENRCAVFFEKKMFIRKRRILILLKRIFGVAEKPKPKIAGVFALPDPPAMSMQPKHRHIVVAWPFIHAPGQTRSTVMMEDIEIFPDNRTLFSFQSYHESEAKSEHDDEPKLRASSDNDDDDASAGKERYDSMLQDDSKASRSHLSLVSGAIENKEAKDSKETSEDFPQGEPPVGDALADAKEVAPSSEGEAALEARAADGKGNVAVGDVENEATAITSARQVSLERLESRRDGEAVETSGPALGTLGGADGAAEEKEGSDSGSGSESGSGSGSSYSSSGSSYSGSSDSDSDSENDSSSDARDKERRLDPIQEEEGGEESNKSGKSKQSSSPSSKTITKSPRVKSGKSRSYERMPSRSNKKGPKQFTLPPTKKKGFFQRLFGRGKNTNSGSVKFKTDIFDDETSADIKKGERRRGKRLKMPKIIYTEPIEGKEFQKKVKYLATVESGMVSRLQLLGVSAAEESRTYTNRGYTVEDMKNVGETPGWLLQHDRAEGHVESESKEDDDEDGANAKDGRFGPPTAGLNMPLPSAYPAMAGYAKEALKANLKKDEKAKKKIEAARIPGPDEAVRLKEEREKKKYFETPKWLVKRRQQKELARMIELDVGINIMLSSGYPAGRRESLTVLPGMTKHYPNNWYVNRAVLPPGYEVPKEKAGLLRGLFGKKKKQSKNSSDVVIAPSVGRKPITLCSQHATFPSEAKDDDSAVGQVDNNSVFPFLADDGTASVSSVEQGQIPVDLARRGSTSLRSGDDRRASVTDATGRRASVTDDAGRRASVTDATGRRESTSEGTGLLGDVAGRRGSVKDGIGRRGSTREGGRRKSVNPDDATVGSSEVNPHPGTVVSGVGSVSGSVGGNTATSHQTCVVETNGEHLLIASFAGGRSVPKGVYLDRRGSFHVAPGLENFSKYLEEKKDVLKNMKYDQFGRLVTRKDKSTTLMTERKEITAPGLIRVMHTNGFDIAHQGTIYDAIFSPSENRIVSCGGDHLIKLWDPRDGSFVRRLVGHTNEVTAISYTSDELYLVSAGADLTILVWDMSVFSITRTLRGHSDVINGLCISFDCSFVVSCSFDSLIKTWFMTPRQPDAPLAPKIVTKTESTVMISWQAPPSFNEPLTAFHLQYQVPGQENWGPVPAMSIPPHYRQKTITGLSPCTTYQFRLRASNKMGESEWGAISKLVKTNMGYPLVLERPDICDITGYSVSLYFFTPNPKLFGAAPTKFIISWTGEGKDYSDENTQIISLEDGTAKGEALIQNFTYWASEEGQKKKQRSKKNGKMYKNMSAIDVPVQTMQATLARNESVNSLLMSTEITGMLPGCLYRFRVAGINSFGQGEWSESSYSQGTLPGIPVKPNPPYKIASDLTWITLKWDPPNDSGSAIVGYRVWIKHINYYSDVPRAQVTFQMTRLLPGQHYFMKVLAKNAVGWSEYSEYNSIDQAETSTAPPDTPGNPRAIGAGWGYMRLEAQLSFGNGREITHMYVQYRQVEAFSKGAWSREFEYDMSKDVIMIESPSKLSEDHIDDEDGDKPKTVRKRERIVRMATGVLEEIHTEINTTIEKPEGKKFTFEVNPLEADTLYEFRISFKNETGRSEYGIPSQRAKTRLPQAPDKCKAPRCLDLMPTFILIAFSHPSCGGAPIINFTLNLEDVTEGVTKGIRIMAHCNEFKLEGLKPGASYRMCIRADNNVGEGEFSNWTKVVRLPKDKTEIAERKLQQDL